MFPVSSHTRLGNMILHLWLEIRKLEIGKPLTFRSLKSALISFGLGANLTSSSGPVSGPIAQATGWPIYHVLTELGLGLKLLGPTPLTWAAQESGANISCGPAKVAQFCSLGTVPKTAPISEFCRAVFSKRNRAIFPTSGNFQNYLFN